MSETKDEVQDVQMQDVESVPKAAVVVERVVKKGRKQAAPSALLDAVTAAALSTAVSTLSEHSFHTLAGLLAVSSDPQTIFPTPEQVKLAARKSVADQPPWVHMSKSDMAPQFKVESNRLSLQGSLRGYRMARASHGASSGCYFFECLMLPGPSATEIVNSLPPNARLGPGLREQLEKAMEYEKNKAESPPAVEALANPSKKRKIDERPPQVGGHIRVGWSMRTGDLQAPVGYDKWSYGIRDTGGSIIHCSHRQDDWGGEGFVPGDVIGCAICFSDEEDDDEYGEDNAVPKNHIRFFKNGDCMGQFVISKGKREGGEAFSGIEKGTYYPAISCYMGGSVRVNFGPHFICPPKRSRLPAAAFKSLTPISSQCPPPLAPEEAVNFFANSIKLFKKPEHQQAFKDAIAAEAQVQGEAYREFMKTHVQDILEARQKRGLSVQDLPDIDNETSMET
jgi:hypothetical protein